MWETVLHAGLAGSFLRLPHVPPDAVAIRAAGSRAAIYGIPFDSTSVSRTGASFGPRAVRESTFEFLSYNATWEVDLKSALSPVDCGDCVVIPGNAQRTFDRARADIGAILDAGALPAIIGGDHSISIPGLWAVKDRYENPGLILFDTHLDTAPDMAGEKLNHCCEISRAVDAGYDPSHIVLVGINGWMNPKSELDYCREKGITVIWIEEIWERGITAVVEDALGIAARDSDGFYLSVDIDVLDAAHAAGTCGPTPGGLSSRELLSAIRRTCGQGMLALDVVETAPFLEATPSTALIATRIILDALAAYAGAPVLRWERP
jgi:agmatinase